MTEKLSLRALNRSLLARQMLLERESVTVSAAVERLAGMQAQLARPPYIGLWSRIEGFERNALTSAVEKRQLVRATLMRGTIHLVTKKDFLAFRPAIQPVLTRGAEALAGEALQAMTLESILDEGRAFFGRQPRTFDAFRKDLEPRFRNMNPRQMAYLVRLHLPLVQVPEEGVRWGYPGSADFALAGEWLGETLGNDDGAHAMAMRYFAAFGPATAADWQTWSGFQNGRELIAELRPKLRVFHDERGRELFDHPKAPHPDEDTPAPVRFLPDFDNILLAHADRKRIIADDERRHIGTGNLRILPTFLVDGFVAGTWTVEKKKGIARLMLTSFKAVAKATQKQLLAEGERLVRFVEEDAKGFEVTIAKM